MAAAPESRTGSLQEGPKAAPPARSDSMQDSQDFATHVRWLLKEFPLIQGLDPDLQAKVPDILAHAALGDDQVVLRQGDLPERCYIVLSGEVMVLKKDARPPEKPPKKVQGSPTTREHCLCIGALLAKEAEEAVAAEKERAEREQQMQYSWTEADEDEDEEEVPKKLVKRFDAKDIAIEDDDKEDRISKYGPHIATLGAGIMFGEMGLLEDQPRNATIVCRGDCEFLVIEREDFDRVLKERMKTGKVRELKNHVGRLVQEFAFVKRLDPAVQQALLDRVSYVSKARETVILARGEVPKDCHILLKGKVALWGRSRRWGKVKQLPLADKGGDVDGVAQQARDGVGYALPEEGSEAAVRQASAIISMLAEEGSGQTREANLSEEVRKRMAATSLPEFGKRLADLGPGAIFGDSQLLANRRCKYTATCEEACEFLVISRNDLQALITESGQVTKLRRLRSPIQALLQEYPFFQAMDQWSRDRVAESVSFTSAKEGAVVFRQDDPPDNWFVVLSGRLGVRMKEPGESPYKAADSLPARKMCSAIAAKLADRGRSRLGAAQPSDEPPFEPGLGHHVGDLEVGDLFGETPFTKDEPRLATVRCSQDCEFLVISNSALEKAIQQEEQSALPPSPEACAALLSALPFFQTLPRKVQQRLGEIARCSRERREALLCWQDDVPSRCAVLLQGKVEAWRRAEGALPPDPPELDAGPSRQSLGEAPPSPTKARGPAGELPGLCEDLAVQIYEAEQKRRASEASIQVKSSGIKMQASSRSNKQQRSLKISRETCGTLDGTLEAGEIFGELALTRPDPPPQPCTLLVQSDCRMLVVERKDFERLEKEEELAATAQREKQAVRRLLREFPSLQGLDPVVLEGLPDVVRCVRAKQGQVLFEPGQAPTCTYLVLAGEVTLWEELDLSAEESFRTKLEEGGSDAGGLPAAGPRVPLGDSALEGASTAASTAVGAGSRRPGGSKESQEVAAEEEAWAEPAPLRHAGSSSPTGARKRRNSASSSLFSGSAWSEDEDELREAASPAGSPSGRLAAAQEAVLSEALWEEGASLGAPRKALVRCRELRDAIRRVWGPQVPSQGTCLDDLLLQEYGVPLQRLGPGQFVGEGVLLDGGCEAFSASCTRDCELLAIAKADWQEILQKEAERVAEEKLHFLRRSIPGARSWSQGRMEDAIRHFEKVPVPRHHVFFEQGAVADGAIFFVFSGSVDTYTAEEARLACGPLPDTGFRRLGALLPGSVVASWPKGAPMPFSAVSSSPCEVLRITEEDLRKLHPSAQRSVEELVEQSLARRRPGSTSQAKAPAPAQEAPPAAPQPRALRSAGSALPGTALRPWSLTVGGPQVAGPRARRGGTSGGMQSLLRNKGLPHHPFDGVFKKDNLGVDFMEYTIEPGECLAMTAVMPKRRELGRTGSRKAPAFLAEALGAPSKSMLSAASRSASASASRAASASASRATSHTAPRPSSSASGRAASQQDLGPPAGLPEGAKRHGTVPPLPRA